MEMTQKQGERIIGTYYGIVQCSNREFSYVLTTCTHGIMEDVGAALVTDYNRKLILEAGYSRDNPKGFTKGIQIGPLVDGLNKGTLTIVDLERIIGEHADFIECHPERLR